MNARNFVFAFCTLFATACRRDLAPPRPSADTEIPKDGGHLRVGVIGDLTTLDPAVANGGVATSPLQLIYAGLVDYDRDGKIVPALAERFDVAEGGRRLDFRLRPGSMFHDGSEVTASDIVRSWERAFAKETPNPNASFFSPIVGFEAFSAGKAEHLAGARVTGRYTLSVDLVAPSPTFLNVLAMHTARPVCPTGGLRVVDAFEPCGAGPFKTVAGGWEKGLRLRLVRHDRYFRPGLPHLDDITYLLSAPAHTQLAKFEGGELDLLRDIRQSDIVRFQGDSRWKPFGSFEAEVQMMGEALNTELAPFDDVRVRQAVSAAINREELRAIRPGNLSSLTQPVPRGVARQQEKPNCQTFDLEKSRALLRDAGHPNGFKETLPYYVYPSSLAEGTAQILQQQLARVGIFLELRVVNFPAYMALTHRRKNVPISSQGWVADYPDPEDFLEPLFHSRAINDSDSNNSAFYSSSKLDSLLDAAHSTIDPAVRDALLNQAEQLICDDAPWAFTLGFRYFDVRQPYVRGYRPHPYWFFDVTEAWLDPATPTQGRGPFTERIHAARPYAFLGRP